MLIIAAETISTSLAQPDLLDLPIRRLLKDELWVSETQMAMFFGIGALAWYVKPLAGLLVDSIALFGTHRRYYLIFSALLAAACSAPPRNRFAFLFPIVDCGSCDAIHVGNWKHCIGWLSCRTG